MKEKKTIREQGIEDLLPHLIRLANKTLTKFEQTILTEILINNKTFNEVAKTNSLPMLRQKQLFNIGIKNLGKILDHLSENISSSKAMEKELAETKENLTKTKEKLEALQNSIEKRNKLSPELKGVLDTPIDKVGFSARVRNICSKAEIETISDLVHYSRIDIGKLRDMGQKSLDEMETYLKSKGLSWKMRF